MVGNASRCLDIHPLAIECGGMGWRCLASRRSKFETYGFSAISTAFLKDWAETRCRHQNSRFTSGSAEVRVGSKAEVNSSTAHFSFGPILLKKSDFGLVEKLRPRGKKHTTSFKLRRTGILSATDHTRRSR